MTTQTTLPQTDDYSHLPPLPDPPREPDMVQRKTLTRTDGTLEPHFADRSDVLITGEIYVIQSEGDAVQYSPDLIFATEIANPDGVIRRNGYVIDQVGKPPDLVLEVASRSTGRRDYTDKREGYAALGIPEYWRFDPSGGEFHDAPLAGDTLVNDEYQPIEITVEPDGRSWGYSEVLGLELWWIEEKLRFRDPVTGEFLPTPDEINEERLAALARADEEWARAEREREARLAAEAREHATRLAAEARMGEMEAELRRLRGE